MSSSSIVAASARPAPRTIRQWLRAHRASQQVLADLLGCTQAMISKLIHKERAFRLHHGKNAVKKTGLPLEEFCFVVKLKTRLKRRKPKADDPPPAPVGRLLFVDDLAGSGTFDLDDDNDDSGNSSNNNDTNNGPGSQSNLPY